MLSTNRKNTNAIKDAIFAAYMLTEYGKDGGEVSSERPIYLSTLNGGWEKDCPEVSFVIGGSPNKARGFVNQTSTNLNEYLVELTTVHDEYVRVYVENGQITQITHRGELQKFDIRKPAPTFISTFDF